MAISVDFPTGVITVPKADTTLVELGPPEIRELNINTFRLALHALQDDSEGMPWTKIFRHNTTVTVGGVTLARVVEILDPYTVTFENGSYAVNLVGANNNVGDVLNFNMVQVRPSNSAGLIDFQDIGLIRKVLTNRRELADGTTGNFVIYDDDDAAVLLTFDVTDETDSAIALGAGDPAKQSKGV